MTEAKRGEGVTRSSRDLCWNCQSEVGGEYFCPQCVKVQPAPPEEQAISLENSALVNTAYRTLRDPIARVEYLIGLEEGAVKGIPPKAPLDLLEEMLLGQEALEGGKASALDAPP